MRNITKTFIALFAIFTFSACSNVELIEVNNKTSEEIETFSFDKSDVVDKSTLADVIKGHLKRERKIKEMLPYKISTIKDASGDVYMYVVNFCENKGYVIISATKNYEPILAFSDKGNFQTDLNFNLGIELWKIQTINDMKRVDNLEESKQKEYQPLWQAYSNGENKIVRLKSNLSTQGLGDDPDYIMMHYIDRWRQEGYTICHLEDHGWTTGDENLDNNIRGTAFNNTWAIYDENWEHYSIMVYKEHEDDYEYPNFVKSTWEQSFGYNNALPSVGSLNHAYTGCAILAVAQTMRYFEKPEKSASFPYDLSAMPYNYATDETANFILDVFNKFTNKDVKEDATSSNINESKAVLEKYGYSATLKDGFDVFFVERNMAQKKPVIMRGQINNPKKGHQWLVTGTKKSFVYTKYELYTFTRETEFTNVWNYESDQTTRSQYFYMNWGWGGYNDGYFDLSSLKFPSYDENISSVKILYDITYK